MKIEHGKYIYQGKQQIESAMGRQSDTIALQQAQLAAIEARANAATEGPWFLSDCEGEVIILPEADLTRVHRSEDGTISSWGMPTNWRPERRILEVELDSWDEGEDEQDDQVRSNAEFIAHARTDVPALLALVREQAVKLAAVRVIERRLERSNQGEDREIAEDLRGALEPTP